MATRKNNNRLLLPTIYPTVFIEIFTDTFEFKIIQFIHVGYNFKIAVRRRVVGRVAKGRTGQPKRNQWGDKLYKGFESLEDAKTNAYNFIENFFILYTDGKKGETSRPPRLWDRAHHQRRETDMPHLW